MLPDGCGAVGVSPLPPLSQEPTPLEVAVYVVPVPLVVDQLFHVSPPTGLFLLIVIFVTVFGTLTVHVPAPPSIL